jgi:hypothetical protein
MNSETASVVERVRYRSPATCVSKHTGEPNAVHSAADAQMQAPLLCLLGLGYSKVTVTPKQRCHAAARYSCETRRACAGRYTDTASHRFHL